MSRNSAIVSSDDEALVLVDEDDNPLGRLSKRDCHRGSGTLHRTFSLFVFNHRGDVLLQQRSSEKLLWPLYWSNTCCSHPRWGEAMAEAVQRRLREELGMSAGLEFVHKFRYQASFGDRGSEHELCWVYAGLSTDPVEPNAHEVASWRFVPPEQLDEELQHHPDRYTPWLKLAWPRIRHSRRA